MSSLCKYACLAAFILLFGCCRTAKPLSAKELEAKREKLLTKPQVIAAPIPAIDLVIKDTVYIERLTRVETSTTYFDTAQLKAFLDSQYVRTSAEMISLQYMIAGMQASLNMRKAGTDSVRVLQSELSTTKKEQIAAKEIIETNKKIVYEGPKYVYGALLFVIAMLFLTWRYLKRKLDRKQKAVNL